MNVKIDGVADVIEKGFDAGITVALGGLLGALGELDQKGQNLIRSDGFYFQTTKLIFKVGEKELIISLRVFFSN